MCAKIRVRVCTKMGRWFRGKVLGNHIWHRAARKPFTIYLEMHLQCNKLRLCFFFKIRSLYYPARGQNIFSINFKSINNNLLLFFTNFSGTFDHEKLWKILDFRRKLAKLENDDWRVNENKTTTTTNKWNQVLDHESIVNEAEKLPPDHRGLHEGVRKRGRGWGQPRGRRRVHPVLRVRPQPEQLRLEQEQQRRRPSD